MDAAAAEHLWHSLAPPGIAGPAWRWSYSELEPALRAVGTAGAVLLARVAALSDEYRQQLEAELCCREAVSTAALDGVVIDSREARMLALKRLRAGRAATAPDEESAGAALHGLIDLLADASGNPGLMSETRLRVWHQGLFPSDTGVPSRAWPEAGIGPFLHWFNGTGHASKSGLDAPLRCGIAQLWFETQRPFEDGNGRIGRALGEQALIVGQATPAEGRIARIQALSPVFLRRQRDYQDQLEAARRGESPDITPWLLFVAACMIEADTEALRCIDRMMQIAWFWVRHRGTPLNDRQRKALDSVLSSDPLDGGWLTNRLYSQLTQCPSAVTASRDLAQLEQLGLIRRDPGAGGRSTRYEVVLS